jgi:hypothetical protein
VTRLGEFSLNGRCDEQLFDILRRNPGTDVMILKEYIFAEKFSEKFGVLTQNGATLCKKFDNNNGF